MEINNVLHKKEERPPSSHQLDSEVNINTGQTQSLADGLRHSMSCYLKIWRLWVQYMHINMAELAGEQGSEHLSEISGKYI